jgi:hypothetical protein
VVKNEIWIDQIVRAGHRATFTFQVDKRQEGFVVRFDGRVREEAKDLNFVLMPLEDYEKWTQWEANRWKEKKDEAGNVMIDKEGFTVTEDIPEPETCRLLNLKSNALKEEVLLEPGTYVLVLNNKYSTVTDKSLDLHITEQWNESSS